MEKKKNPKKLSNILGLIKECIQQGKYIFSTHALDRVVERRIDVPIVLKILQTGYEEKIKDRFDPVSNVWRYAVRGKTVEILEEESKELDIRIIVVIEEDGMVVITVMHVL